MTIGERIRSLRIACGWTQITLAEKSGLSRNSINRYEKDEAMPRMPQIKAIAAAMGMSYEGLMSGEESANVTLTTESGEQFDGELVRFPKGHPLHAPTMQEMDIVDASAVANPIEVTIANVKDALEQDFQKLNPKGKREAAKRVQELTQIDEYTK